MSEPNPESLPVIPDAIARKLDKGQSVAVEEVREAAVDQIVSGKTNPVHAENLRPISKAEAAARTNFGPAGTGTSMPSFPQTRRVIPAPFKRPRINADRHGKTWQWVRADLVVPGDIVPEVGEVHSREERVLYRKRSELVSGLAVSPDPDVAVGVSIVLTGIDGACGEFAPGDDVHVFRR